MSGFFLAKRLYDKGDKTYWRKALHRQIGLYLKWSLLFLPINIWGELHVYHHHGSDMLWSLLQGWFLVGENYGSWPLWYLLASIIGIAVIVVLDKLGCSKKRIIFCAIVVYVIGLVLVRMPRIGVIDYAMNVLDYFHDNRNGLFFGWAFLSIGLLGTIKIDRIILYVLLAVLLFAGCFVNPSIIVWPLTVACMQILLPLQMNGKTGHYVLMRKLSTLNYFLHMFVVFLLIDMLRLPIKGIELFLVVSAITTMLSYMVIIFNTKLLNKK